MHLIKNTSPVDKEVLPPPASALGVAPQRVLHAVGALSESVVRFLVPALTALQSAGVRQYVLALNGSGQRDLVERYMPTGVSLTVADERASTWRRCKHWMSAYRDIQSAGGANVVHAHGAMPLTLLAIMRGIERPRRLLYSPLGAWGTKHWTPAQARAYELLTLPVGSLGRGAVVSSHHALAHRADRTTSGKASLIDPPLHSVFHLMARAPGRLPLVVASAQGESRRAASALAQLSVLAENGSEHAAVFQWVGKCDAAGERILNAAGVAIDPDPDPLARAERLSAAWVFASPGPDQGFPWHIVEAMACGLPVVALDTPCNRRLLVRGITGFLCRNAEEMLAPLLTLLKHPELRLRLGEAGRSRVLAEFGHEAFMVRLLDTYGLEPLNLRAAQAQEPPRQWRVG